MKILFIHGLESGPGGHKHSILKTKYQVLCPDMTLYSKISNNFYRNPFFITGLLLIPSIICISVFYNFWILLFLPISSLLFWVYGCSYIMKKCIAIQEEALRIFQPDIIVGSSFGSAISLLLIKTKTWQGPTLLLAPAHGAVRRRCLLFNLLKFERGFSLGGGRKIFIVHGSQDEVCPLKDSLDLLNQVGNDKIELKIVEDTHSLKVTFSSNYEDLINRALEL